MWSPSAGNHPRPTREYLIYYRGPGFLAVDDLAPPPLSREHVVSLSPSSCVSPVELTDGEGGGGGGAKS
jgi:hypothetical protein